jgi:hypothetical protein
LDHAAAFGITLIQDVTSWEDWSIYQTCHAQGKLKVQIYARTPLEEWEKQLEWIQTSGSGDE